MIIISRIATMLHGFFEAIGDNETSLVSTKDDPPKHRMGVQWQDGWGRSMGAVSWNVVRPDREEDEIALLQGKIDDRFPLTDKAGEWRLDLRAPDDASDAGMREVFRMFHDHARFSVPVTAPNLGSGGGGHRAYSANGQFYVEVQDDGNLVVRRADTTPVWSWMTGPL